MERMKMSERIAAAANSPTPEQVKAAHEAASQLAASIVWDGMPIESVHKCLALVDQVRAGLMPRPEPERPRITPARELAGDQETRSDERIALDAIRNRDSEIVAWLEWEIDQCSGSEDCMHCRDYEKLANLIRKADQA